MQTILCSLLAALSVASACEWGWKEHEGRCYKLQSQRWGWTRQNLECVYAGGALASATSYSENEFIRSLANGQTIYLGGASFGWDWEWSDGASFYGFSNWKNYEDAQPPPGKPCIKMLPSGYWTASCCANPPAPAVCVRRW